MGNQWDASSHHNVSTTQESWGLEVLEWVRWDGNEVVLDSSCGSGRLTHHILGKVPQGFVYAVDLDPDMVSHVRKNLPDFKYFEVIEGDISHVLLPTQVDEIFSNAAIHWILDHR